MALTRTNPASWGVGDKLTSAQANGLDVNTTNALDKRSGQTDTLGSVVSLSGSGRIVTPVSVGPDANTTLFAGTNANVVVSTLTAARTYTLSVTGAVAGDIISITNGVGFPITVIDGFGGTIQMTIGSISTTAETLWAEFMFNGSGWLLYSSARRPNLTMSTFTASGTWTCPVGVYFATLYGFGAGGGGAAGGNGVPSNTLLGTIGGGGGGGARPQFRVVPVTPGTTYNVTIPTGGAGAAAGSNAAGSDGGDTTFDVLATFRGAGGGTVNTSTVTSTFFATGGSPVKGSISASGAGIKASFEGSFGGYGSSFFFGSNGNPSLEGFAGGAFGNAGSSSGTNQCGGGGGGGGAGPAGAGGTGGTGGNGVAGGGTNGSAGSSTAANTGAGGGGGGGGGSCAVGSTAGFGGAGGNGGSGYLIVVPMR